MAPTKDMEYVRLGKSGLKVSKIILGCMSYGGWEKWCLSEEEGIKHIKFAYDAGVNTFDTSNIYSDGQSEVILGKALKQHKMPRDSVVILTKLFGAVRHADDPGPPFWDLKQADKEGYVNQSGLSRKHIFEAVQHSLRRLDMDYIDVLQCHRFDPNTPIEETMQALHDVVKAGYVRYIGMSSCHAWQFHVMQNYAITHNLTPFISMQNHHNLVYREEEREMFPTLSHFGVGAIPWSPLARGLLTRPWDQMSATKRAETDYMLAGYAAQAASKTIVDRVEEIAKKKRIPMAQVALAWSMQKDGVSAPVIGTSSLDNLKQLIAGIHVRLDEDEVKYLEEPYKPQAVFGHS